MVGVDNYVICKLSQERMSSAPRGLTPAEEDFFMLVADGKVRNVKKFVRKQKRNALFDFDVNCVNFEYANAMSIAVDNGNVKMVKYLFKVMDTSKHSVLLKSTLKGDADLVKFLCEKMDADCDGLQHAITPLLVAAMNGHFEIVGYFIDRCHLIEEPHKPECLCKETCLPRLRCCDPLEQALHTWRTYAALSNPSYFVYITTDPIHYAFKLHRRLVKLSKFESPFKPRYVILARKMREFAACLAGCCKSNKEMKMILRKRNTPMKKMSKVYQGEFPRLLMAIDYDQVEFVCHPKVQLALQQKFLGSFEDFAYFSTARKVTFTILRIFTIPAAYVTFLLHPSSKTAKFYASPINRMLHFVASYLVFLMFLFIESRRDKAVSRACLVTSFSGKVIFAYFCGWSGSVMSQFFNMRPGRFFHYGWNIYDVITLTVFGLTIAFGIAATVHAKLPCIPDVERKYWASLDPLLIAEGLYVLGSVLGFMKILYFLQAHNIFGPAFRALYQVSEAACKYSVCAVVVVLAYTTAFSKFYSYYSGMTYIDSSHETSTQEESFTDWVSSFKTFFWLIFHHTEVPVADVVVESNNQHQFTQKIGYVALGSFTLIMYMLLINVLIVTTSETLPSADNLRRTWLYARATIFLYFMHFPVMPPPFNLLPQFYTVRYFQEKSYLERRCKDKFACDYVKLTRILVERYFNRMSDFGSESRPFKPKRGSPKTRCRRL